MLIRSKENTFTARFTGGEESVFLKGITLIEILEYTRPTDSETIILAKVNNRVCNIREQVDEDCLIEWIHLQSIEGIRSYNATLCLVLIRVIHELYPDNKIRVEQSLANGLFCTFRDGKRIGRRKVKKIKNRMGEIIQNDESIQPVTLLRNQALALFDDIGERPILFLENLIYHHKQNY